MFAKSKKIQNKPLFSAEKMAARLGPQGPPAPALQVSRTHCAYIYYIYIHHKIGPTIQYLGTIGNTYTKCRKLHHVPYVTAVVSHVFCTGLPCTVHRQISTT